MYWYVLHVYVCILIGVFWCLNGAYVYVFLVLACIVSIGIYCKYWCVFHVFVCIVYWYVLLVFACIIFIGMYGMLPYVCHSMCSYLQD